MFDRLSEGFNGVFRKLSGRAEITEKNVREAMDEVRTALLDADVHLDVVESFCDEVLQDAIGQEVTKSLKPGQEIIGIVHRRLIRLLGGDPDAEGQPGVPSQPPSGIMSVSPGPTVVMMSGLQGSGKTTTCGKLAAMLMKQGKNVVLCAADLQRPAAVEQLQTIGEQLRTEFKGRGSVEVYAEPERVAEYGKAVGVAVKVCQNALKHARSANADVLILDTAGRLHVNDELMGELRRVNATLQPHHVFLIVDAMTGQDAVNSAKAFHEQLAIDGLILTKFDSDTRGGAALSAKRITGAPIRYIGIGEKLDAIEPFHAERMAGRILGMGDVVSLVEKAQEEVSEEEAETLRQKIARGEMGMDDFLKQLKMLRRMGPMKQLLGMLPGVGQALKNIDIDDKELDKVEAVINSMTKEERKSPDVINTGRRRRIARGSGSEPERISQLVKQFGVVGKMGKQMATMSGADRAAAAKQLSAGGLMPGLGGMPGFGGKGSTKASAGGKRFKQRKKKRR
ncbi:MAG: signal recognition particle protein [Planctomycetota bacterium]